MENNKNTHEPKGSTPRIRDFSPVRRTGDFSPVFHNPPHLYINNTIYFITSGTYKKQILFNTDEKKLILENQVFTAIKQHDSAIFGWAIMDDHYHLLFKMKEGKKLGCLIQKINGTSSFLLNKYDVKTNRKVWYSYWDECVTNEEKFYTLLNYIHQNPIKHRQVTNIKSLALYPFSSYPFYLKKKGEEWLNDCFVKYPILNYVNENET